MGFKLISSENVSILCKMERHIINDLIIGQYAAEMADHLEEVKLNKKVASKTGYTSRGKAHKQNPYWILKYLLKADSAYFGHVALLSAVILEKCLTPVSKCSDVLLVTFAMCEEYRSCHWKARFSFLFPFLNNIKQSVLHYIHPHLKTFVVSGWYSGCQWIWKIRNRLCHSKRMTGSGSIKTKRKTLLSHCQQRQIFSLLSMPHIYCVKMP